MYKLLIVDDESSIRNGIRLNCDWQKYQIDVIEVAVNGLDAWEKVQRNPPDFIITDIKMPVMDGLDLIKKVSEEYPDILCAVLSGYDEFDFVREAMQYHTQDYLLKPCSVEAINELTEKLIERKKALDLQKQYISEIEKKYLHMKNILTEHKLPHTSSRAVNDIALSGMPDVEFFISSEIFNLDLFCLCIQRNHVADAHDMLSRLHDHLSQSQYDGKKVRAYLTHIYIALIQSADTFTARKAINYLDEITQINTLSSLKEIIALIEHTAENIAASFEIRLQKKQNELVKKIFSCIDDYLSDERLSLNFIANKILFVNADYLGKLFHAECGERFSSYVTRKRIEDAKKLIEENHEITIGEVALQTGFGYNSQYFSKVFKKNTGYTPTEYRNRFSRDAVM